jgi:DNA-binding NtrC family response regulator
VSAGAERLLQQAAWPGNVRELRNVLERASILSATAILSERDIAGALAPAAPAPGALAERPVEAAAGSMPDDPHLLTTAQRAQIQRVLEETAGNKAAAARLLGVSRRSLYRWLERLDMPS